MKKIITLLLLVFVAISSGCSLNTKKEPLDKESFYIRKVLANTANNLEHSHDIHAAAFGMAAMEEVESLKLHFQVNRKLSKDEIRPILLDCVAEMVKNVHECEGIQPYLLPEGFSEKNVEIGLYFSEKRKEVAHPNIAVAAIYNGEIEYRTVLEGEPYKYHSDERESYEEAVAIVESQKKRAA